MIDKEEKRRFSVFFLMSEKVFLYVNGNILLC